MNRLAMIFCLFSVVGQGASAQNILEQILGLDQNVAREAAEQAALFQEESNAEAEPSLAELIDAEKSDYPQLVSSTQYMTRTDCVAAITGIYETSLIEGIYAIPRMDFWLDRYIDKAREIYICDGAMLNAYYDDNNSIPVRWRMVRSSVDIILTQLEAE